jgi:hypothetical protein
VLVFYGYQCYRDYKMVDLDIKSFIHLKYQIITEDRSTWYLCETYPKIVCMKWALRCARDVEHCASKYPRVKACNDLLQEYINNGMPKEMHDRLREVTSATVAGATTYAAYASYYAASPATAAYAVANAARYTASIIALAAKWSQYIEWLIEELCEYENK